MVHLDLRPADKGLTAQVVAENIANFRSRLQKYNPLLVIVELGGNDRMFGIDPDSIVRSLATIVQAIQEANAAALLMEVVPDGLEREVCDQTGALLVPLAPDIHDELGTSPDCPLPRGAIPVLPAKFFQSDGIHPNHRAQVLLSRSVACVLDGVGSSNEKLVPWSMLDALEAVQERKRGQATFDCSNYTCLCM